MNVPDSSWGDITRCTERKLYLLTTFVVAAHSPCWPSPPAPGLRFPALRRKVKALWHCYLALYYFNCVLYEDCGEKLLWFVRVKIENLPPLIQPVTILIMCIEGLGSSRVVVGFLLLHFLDSLDSVFRTSSTDIRIQDWSWDLNLY